MSDWTGGTANWDSTASRWTPANLPNATTDATFNAASGASTVTLVSGHDGCRDLNFTGFTGTFAGTFGFIGGDNFIFGSLTCGASMGWTYTGQLTFAATSGTKDVTTNGIALDNAMLFSGVGGSWRLMSNVVNGATRAMTVNIGTFDFNDFNYTGGSLAASLDTNARTINCGNGTITLNATSGNVINFGATSANLTFNAEGSTILVSANTASNRTIAGRGKSFNILELAGAGTGDLLITSNLTAATLRISDAPQEIVVTAGVTITVGDAVLSGTAGNINTYSSATAGTPWILAKTGGGIITCDYVSITDCHPPEGTYIYAGIHSTDGGHNNERVIFSDVSGAGLSIPANGRIVTNPDYLYVMETYADAADTDVGELRTFATNNGIFAGINMSLDWKLREWDMIKAATAWIAAHFHWIGISTLTGRPINMLNTLATDGHLLAWGSTDPSGTVTAIGALSPAYRYTKVAAGTDFAAAIEATNFDIKCYGSGAPAATISSGADSFVDVACGAGHVVGLKDTGSVTASGDNGSGQTATPSGNGSVAGIACGDTFSAYLLEDGTVEVVGSIQSDVTLAGTYPNANGHFVQIAAGGGHIVGLLDDGTVVAWGRNDDGECTVPSLTGKDVLNIHADASRSYVSFELSNGSLGIQSWGKAITLGAVASNMSAFATSSMNYIISPSVALPQTVTISGDAADMPIGGLPALPTDTSWVAFAGGDRFGVGIANMVWPCGSITAMLQGLLVAHGIPARHIAGADLSPCSGDRILEVWSSQFNKRILIWPNMGLWIEDASGTPQSYAEVRAAHDAGNYAITNGWEIGKKGRGYKFTAANGSGLVGMPSDIMVPALFPHRALNWWSGLLQTPTAGTDLFEVGQTTSTTKFSTNPQSSTTIYFESVNACGIDSTGQGLAAEDDDDISYPLNQVYATAELTVVSPPTVRITLTNNMTNGTGGTLDHYDASVNGGATWALISTLLTDEGGGVYTWLPGGPKSLLIRGVNNGAGAHSPDVQINYNSGSGGGRKLRWLLGM